MKTVKSPDGLLWSVDGDSDDMLPVHMHERPLIEIGLALLPVGGHLVDIGAHVGTWAVRFAKAGRTVTAIEANPLTFLTLCRNSSLNGVQHMLTPVNRAAWDRTTDLVLADENGKLSGGSTWVTALSSDRPSANAIPFLARGEPAWTLVPQPPPARTLVKIDVEGEEARVITSLHTWMRRHQPTLIVELHGLPYKDNNLTTAALDALLEVEYTWSQLIRYGACEYAVAQPASTVSSIETAQPPKQETP